MHMKVHFSSLEMDALAEAEYVRLFGKIPPGYEVHVSSSYGGSDVVVEKSETPKPETVS